MPKNICCCTDETPGTKRHYIAIPCYEYNSNKYVEIAVQKIFKGFIDYGTVYRNPGPTSPFKVVGINDSLRTWKINGDYLREVMLMMRGSGGGARPLSTGGNGAYVDFIAVSGSDGFYQWVYQIQPGGTGPDPANFDTHTTIPMLGGGPGYPLAGWGGGAVAWGYSQEMSIGGRVLTGAGAGAGGDTGTDGGHGGIDNGETGTGIFPGLGGSQFYGGTAGGINATDGIFGKGGRGNGPWTSLLSPSVDGGGGGGAGLYGGGGGGSRSAGGGGSTSKSDAISNQTIDSASLFPGTDVGPGNRCTPYFTLDMDPGLGAQREGRYLEGITFTTGFSGAPGQGAEYHRTKWCPCYEDQVDPEFGGTGKITGPMHICLSEEQYASIIADLPPIAPPGDLEGIRVSFEIDGDKYILVQIDPETVDPSTGHYYCTLGCEPGFVATGAPLNVRWYIPSSNFTCFNEVFDWFSTHLEYNFSNITSCCDCFLGKPICTSPYESCLGSYDAYGNATGCICDASALPDPAAMCKSFLENQNVAFIASDTDTKWVYLVVPGICWTFFGDENITQKFECLNSSKKLVYRDGTQGKALLIPIADATTVDPGEIAAEYCNEEINKAYCTDTGGVNCEITLARVHPYCDYYGIGCNLTVTSKANLCVRTNYGCLACGDCESSDIVTVEADPTMIFNCATRACYGECSTWNPSGEVCQDVNECLDSTQQNYTIKSSIQNYSLKEQFLYFKSKYKGKFFKYALNQTQLVLNTFGSLLYNTTSEEIEKTSSFPVSKIASQIGGCPCDPGGENPTQGCLDAHMIGYKFNIQRHQCPPGNYLSCVCCDFCPTNTSVQECECVQKGSWVDEIDELNSWDSSTCLRRDGGTPSGTGIYEKIIAIQFPACLFSGMTPEEAKTKAAGLVTLGQASVNYAFQGVVYENILVQKLTVCNLQLLLFSTNSGDVAAAINQCLSGPNGGVSASSGNPYVWFTHRLAVCVGQQSTVTLLPGDRLYVDLSNSEITLNGGVVIYLSATSGDAAGACVKQTTQPICWRTDEGCGQGVTNQASAIYAVHAADWAAGQRWIFVQHEQYEQYNNIYICNDVQQPLLTHPAIGGIAGTCMEGGQEIRVNCYGPGDERCDLVPHECGEFYPCCLRGGQNTPCPGSIYDYCDCEPGSNCNYPFKCTTQFQCQAFGDPISISAG